MPSLSFGRDMPQPSVDDEAFARRGRDQDGSPALVRLGQSAIGANPDPPRLSQDGPGLAMTPAAKGAMTEAILAKMVREAAHSELVSSLGCY
jgi:hypothetical protein